MSDSPEIPGLKVIRFTTGRVNEPDDPSLPYKLEAAFRPPEFMQVTFVLMYGGIEEIVVRSETLEGLVELVRQNEWRTHPRLRRLVVTGPEGVLDPWKAPESSVAP